MTIDCRVRAGATVYHLPEDLHLERGGVLTDAQIAYEVTGHDDGPIVVVLGGISAGRHVTGTADDPTPGWWESIVGPSRAIDTDRFRVVGVDYLGGPGSSTGPSSWAGDGPFPLVTTRDQAGAIKLVLGDLGIDKVHRFVGSSFGGMVGLVFAAEYPNALDGLVTIGAAHESHPMASAWRSLQRRIVNFGEEVGRGKDALALARGLAMTTYRTHEEFRSRFTSPPDHVDGGTVLPVEAYLKARGDDFAARFSSDEFLSLLQAIDLHAVDPATIRVPTWLIGFRSDQLVPIQQVAELAELLGPRGRLIGLDSLFGHDGFLKEIEQLTPVLHSALEEGILR